MHCGITTAVYRRVCLNRLPKNIDAVARVDSVELFAEGTDEDDAPETVDGAFGLAAATKPFEHGDATRLQDIGRNALIAQNVEHRAADGELIPQREGAKGCERTHDVEWSRQEARLKLASAPLRVKQEKAIEEFDLIRASDAAIKVFEIGAAAESDVLAIVHVLAVGQHVGGCAAAEEGTLFEQTYAPAGVSQRDAGCQSRQPAADHDHALQGYSLPCGRRSAPWG